MSLAETLLEIARRHLCEGERRVAEQTQRIAELSLDGHDTRADEEYLVLLEQTLTILRQPLAEEGRTHGPDHEP